MPAYDQPLPPPETAPASQAGALSRPGAAVLLGAWALVGGIQLLGGPGLRARFWLPGLFLLTFLAALSLVLRARRCPGRERRAWWLLAASALIDGSSLLQQALQAIGLARLPNFSNLANLLTGALLLAGILAFPRNPDRRGLGRRGALDALLFATSILFLLWVMGMQGSLRSAPEGVGLRVFVAYLNVALLGGALMFMTGNRPDLAPGPLGWLSASTLSWLAALSLWTLAGLPSVVETTGWIVAAGGIPVFQGLAAWSGKDEPPPRQRRGEDQDLVRRLPLMLVALGVLVLAALLLLAPGGVTRGAYAIFLGMVVLLLLRMLQAIQELRAARATLEERVLQRTRALELAQDTLLRAERMNAVATLGAGLTHDLNNFLGVIQTSVELALAEVQEGRSATERNLGRIREAAEQAGRLTRRLMTYGRRVPAPDRDACDLAPTVEAMRELLRMLLPRGISLTLDLEPGTGAVRVDPAVLEQALVNLVSNAKDAMPAGGAVTVRLRRGTAASGEPAALLEISDTGPGIPEHLREVIFDPFFTTKAVGQGTGLGLASVATLMAAQGGEVAIAGEPGQGATFRLTFPVGR